MVDAQTPEQQHAHAANFVESPTFDGAKAGYRFSGGADGVGYYKEG